MQKCIIFMELLKATAMKRQDFIRSNFNAVEDRSLIGGSDETVQSDGLHDRLT
ncbi:hypothetical protein JYU34_000591 [Plutella xylostella]|uniref:Uncharacterized protein n=1 Tax=Plutella xylostella TaxID=51655 RepID=A0ABQ7R853_PLUXY|nr:hypothetical protein JYU34_000591 [Plutella xylostella]